MSEKPWERRQRLGITVFREPWLRCASTHCERRGECASPNGCEASQLPPAKLVIVKD